MNLVEIEQNIEKITQNLSEDSFIFELLSSYGFPSASITRLRKGDYNLSKNSGEVLWKKRLFFKQEKVGDLHTLIDQARNEPHISRQKPRFLIITNFKKLLSLDTKTNDTLDIFLEELPHHFDFFLPWANMEKSQVQGESLADIRAAEKMGKLYDTVLELNHDNEEIDRHALNVFFSRILFCFFAEDTGIFEENIFTNGIASHTTDAGNDLDTYLGRLFEALNAPSREHYPQFLQKFPYVNGGLFAEAVAVPKLSRKARTIILECGSLNWKQINPDIFGSMMQAVVHTSERSNLGMHYTSVANILKVIEPLFLDSLNDGLVRAGSNKKKLNALLERLYRLRIFDPACGSGNFLIIAFKELAKLEIEIYKRLHGAQTTFRFESGLNISQFYGIEVDDFAHETAKLSLWLAEHQMNLEFREVFGNSRPTLPLKEGGNIVCKNATRIDWETVCPKEDGHEIYILGNPPYLGARNQKSEQKQDVSHVVGHINGHKNLDYIACWLYKGAEYIRGTVHKLAFVATNSICQGEQVGILWPSILAGEIEIGFAHHSFKWTNNARGNAGVTCVVIGLRNESDDPKLIFSDLRFSRPVKNINAYLVDAPNVFVERSRSPINGFPPMKIGNKPVDDGNYLFTRQEKQEFVEAEPDAEEFFYRWYGSRELLQGVERWCLLAQRIPQEMLANMPLTLERVERVKRFREESRSKPTRDIAERPMTFHVENFPTRTFLVVPKVSSERREYIPVAFVEPSWLASDLLNVVGAAPPHLFAILSSCIHMSWVKTVSGRLKTDYRYTAALCFNTFPFPEIHPNVQQKLEDSAFKIIEERENHPEKTLSQLYDPDLMPASLKIAHQENDELLDSCFKSQGFASDAHRVEHLLTLYSQRTSSDS